MHSWTFNTRIILLHFALLLTATQIHIAHAQPPPPPVDLLPVAVCTPHSYPDTGNPTTVALIQGVHGCDGDAMVLVRGWRANGRRKKRVAQRRSPRSSVTGQGRGGGRGRGGSVSEDGVGLVDGASTGGTTSDGAVNIPSQIQIRRPPTLLLRPGRRTVQSTTATTPSTTTTSTAPASWLHPRGGWTRQYDHFLHTLERHQSRLRGFFHRPTPDEDQDLEPLGVPDNLLNRHMTLRDLFLVSQRVRREQLAERAERAKERARMIAAAAAKRRAERRGRRGRGKGREHGESGDDGAEEESENDDPASMPSVIASRGTRSSTTSSRSVPKRQTLNLAYFGSQSDPDAGGDHQEGSPSAPTASQEAQNFYVDPSHHPNASPGVFYGMVKCLGGECWYVTRGMGVVHVYSRVGQLLFSSDDVQEDEWVVDAVHTSDQEESEGSEEGWDTEHSTDSDEADMGDEEGKEHTKNAHRRQNASPSPNFWKPLPSDILQHGSLILLGPRDVLDALPVSKKSELILTSLAESMTLSYDYFQDATWKPIHGMEAGAGLMYGNQDDALQSQAYKMELRRLRAQWRASRVARRWLEALPVVLSDRARYVGMMAATVWRPEAHHRH